MRGFRLRAIEDHQTQQPVPLPFPGVHSEQNDVNAVPLAAMLWQLNVARKSLVLSTGGGRIFLRDGEVIHAAVGELVGVGALTRMLAQRASTVHTTPLTDAPQTISEPLRPLLDRILALLKGHGAGAAHHARPTRPERPAVRRGAGGSHSAGAAHHARPPRPERPAVRRDASGSYPSISIGEISRTPTVITTITAPSIAEQTYVGPMATAMPAQTGFHPVALQPAPTQPGLNAQAAAIVLSVMVTLIIALGLLFVFWPQVTSLTDYGPRVDSPARVDPSGSSYESASQGGVGEQHGALVIEPNPGPSAATATEGTDAEGSKLSSPSRSHELSRSRN
jgi:hypothetical protein